MNNIFSRNFPSLTAEEFSLIQNSHIAVVGCGGLGCYAAELLARLGVGQLTIIDGDVFTESNFNRQLYADFSSLGRNKAVVAAERIANVSTETRVRTISEFFNAGSEHFLEGCSIVVDALDNSESRLILSNACSHLQLPLVHGAVDSWCAQVSLVLPGSGIIERLYNSSSDEATRSALSFTVSYCASLQAAEAVKFLIGKCSALENKLFVADLFNNEYDILSV